MMIMILVVVLFIVLLIISVVLLCCYYMKFCEKRKSVVLDKNDQQEQCIIDPQKSHVHDVVFGDVHIEKKQDVDKKLINLNCSSGSYLRKSDNSTPAAQKAISTGAIPKVFTSRTITTEDVEDTKMHKKERYDEKAKLFDQSLLFDDISGSYGSQEVMYRDCIRKYSSSDDMLGMQEGEGSDFAPHTELLLHRASHSIFGDRKSRINHDEEGAIGCAATFVTVAKDLPFSDSVKSIFEQLCESVNPEYRHFVKECSGDVLPSNVNNKPGANFNNPQSIDQEEPASVTGNDLNNRVKLVNHDVGIAHDAFQGVKSDEGVVLLKDEIYSLSQEIASGMQKTEIHRSRSTESNGIVITTALTKGIAAYAQGKVGKISCDPIVFDAQGLKLMPTEDQSGVVVTHKKLDDIDRTLVKHVKHEIVKTESMSCTAYDRNKKRLICCDQNIRRSKSSSCDVLMQRGELSGILVTEVMNNVYKVVNSVGKSTHNSEALSLINDGSFLRKSKSMSAICSEKSVLHIEIVKPDACDKHDRSNAVDLKYKIKNCNLLEDAIVMLQQEVSVNDIIVLNSKSLSDALAMQFAIVLQALLKLNKVSAVASVQYKKACHIIESGTKHADYVIHSIIKRYGLKQRIVLWNKYGEKIVESCMKELKKSFKSTYLPKDWKKASTRYKSVVSEVHDSVKNNVKLDIDLLLKNVLPEIYIGIFTQVSFIMFHKISVINYYLFKEINLCFKVHDEHQVLKSCLPFYQNNLQGKLLSSTKDLDMFFKIHLEGISQQVMKEFFKKCKVDVMSSNIKDNCLQKVKSEFLYIFQGPCSRRIGYGAVY